LVQATRPSVIGSSDSSNLTYPFGAISIDPSTREITGRNPERQDAIIQPISTPATGFSGYFCARFDTEFLSWGTANDGSFHEAQRNGDGKVLSAYVRFASTPALTVNVRVGVSYISVEQARRNLDLEIPDGTSLEETASKTRGLWAEKLNRIQIQGATDDDLQVFYTAFFHTLQVGRTSYAAANLSDWRCHFASIRMSRARRDDTTLVTTIRFTKGSLIQDTPSGRVKFRAYTLSVETQFS
jgi:hypothetical protein